MGLVKKSISPNYYTRFPHPDGSGKPVSLSTGKTNRREAEARAAEIKAEFCLNWKREQSGGNLRSSAVIADYWETEGKRGKAAKSHVLPHLDRLTQFLGEKSYCDVTIADVAAYVDHLDGTLSDSTINRAVSVWRRLHNVAAKRRGLPVQSIDWSQVRRIEPAPVARQIAQPTLRAIMADLTPSAKAIVLFALSTGARKSQVLTLEWDRVDIEHGVATVYRKHRQSYAPQRIELHDVAVAVLRTQERLRAPGDKLVFDATNFRKVWDRAVLRAGVANVRFHDLRHTFATIMARKAPLSYVQTQLGHSSPLLTNRYAHVQRQDLSAAVRQLPIEDILGLASGANCGASLDGGEPGTTIFDSNIKGTPKAA